MADFEAVFNDGDEVTVTAGAAITGGQVCEWTGADTVSPTSAASGKVAGIAKFDAASGGLVTILRTGVVELVTTANVAVGDIIASSTAGGCAPIGAGTFDKKIGVASRAATSPAVARVYLNLM